MTFLYDIKCGCHSNIPLCCILFYIVIWPIVPKKHRRAYLGAHTQYAKDTGIWYEYIPCPICWMRKRVANRKTCTEQTCKTCWKFGES